MSLAKFLKNVGFGFLGALTFLAGLIFIAGFSAIFFRLAWNGVMDEFFPQLAKLGVPMVISWWQAYKLLYLIGIIGSRFTTVVKKDE